MLPHQIEALLAGGRHAPASAEPALPGNALEVAQTHHSTDLVPAEAPVEFAEFGPQRPIREDDLWRSYTDPAVPYNVDDSNAARSLRRADKRLEYRRVDEDEIARQQARIDPEGAQMTVQARVLLQAAQTAVADVLHADTDELPALRDVQRALGSGHAPLALPSAEQAITQVPQESNFAEPGGAFFAEPTADTPPQTETVSKQPEAPSAIGSISVDKALAQLNQTRSPNPAANSDIQGDVQWTHDAPISGDGVNNTVADPSMVNVTFTPVPGEGHTRAINWKGGQGGDGTQTDWMMPSRIPGATLPLDEQLAGPSTHAEPVIEPEADYSGYKSVMADIPVPEAALAAFKSMTTAEFEARMHKINTRRASLEKALEKGRIAPADVNATKTEITLLMHQESELLARRANSAASSNSLATMERVLSGLRKL